MKASVVAAVTLASVAASAFAGLTSVDNAIQITNLSFEQDLGSRDVVVNYTLAGHNAIIRADILTNGVSIGKQYVKTFTGDYSSAMTDVIEPGPHTFRWKARKDWPDQLTGDLQVKLCALYPEEAGKPGVYDEFARAVYANDFTSANLDGWTSELNASVGSFLAVQDVQGGKVLVMRNASSVNGSSATMYTPAFEGLSDWRISFDLGAYCADSLDWDQYWTRWGYSISGLDAEGKEVFLLNGTASARGAAVDSTIGGVTVAGKAVGANTHLTLVRNAAGTITVFGPNDIVGTTSATMTNPNAKITKLKFTIPKQAGSPVVVMYAYLDNLKIEDISAAPF